MAPKNSNLNDLALTGSQQHTQHQWKFNASASKCASIEQTLDTHRVRIVDTNGDDGNVYELSDDRFAQIQCISWSRQPSELLTSHPGSSSSSSSSEDTQKQKKKAKITLEQKELIDILVIGSDNGSIHWYSPSHSSVIRSFTTHHHHHSAPVTDISFPLNTHQMVSCDKSGVVCVWDLLTQDSVKVSWKVSDGCERILADKGLKVICANNAISVYNQTSKQVLETHTGHATSVLGLFGSAELLFSFAEQDRFVNVWKSGVEAPVNALSCESNIVSAHVLGNNCLVVTEDGYCNLWVDAQVQLEKSSSMKKQRKSRSRKADCVIQAMSSSSAKPVSILAAYMISESQVVVAFGHALNPQFEHVRFTQDNGKVIGKIDVAVNLESNLIKNNKKAESRVTAYIDTEATIIGQTDFGLSAVNYQEQQADDASDNGESPEPTLEEKIKALSVEQQQLNKPNTGYTTSMKKAIPKSDSLQQMLVQALHSNDSNLLEECLEIQDHLVVKATIQRLPSSYILPFLTQCVSRFQARPTRARTLTKWVRMVLVTHMAYLMTQPALMSTLAPLYQTIDGRVGVFKKILRLQGRLDVLDAHISQRFKAEDATETAALNNSLDTPAVFYDENEEWTDEEGENDDQMSEDEDGSEVEYRQEDDTESIIGDDGMPSEDDA